MSQITKLYQFSFTEPYFLDRPLAAGFDLYKSQTDYSQATYSSDTTGATLRLGFPISEYSSVGLRYTYQINKVSPFSNAPLEIQLAAGRPMASIFGFTYGYNSLDDVHQTHHRHGFLAQRGFRRLWRQSEIHQDGGGVHRLPARL